MTTPSNKDPRLIPYGSTNLGMPLALADDLIVPNDRFFVRSNGDTPVISRDEWLLTISGEVANPTVLTFGDLLNLPRHSYTAFLECTGNSRSRYSPETEGTPWEDDAVGNAVWSGVSLASVLAIVEPTSAAREVVSQGADLADMQRGLPLAIAMAPDTVLVFEMNGEPLPAAHGGPVRLFVPGWSGIASTKWLTRLELARKPFVGKYQGELYLLFDEDGTPVDAIREMPVKSLIARPAAGQPLKPGSLAITGYAWSGHGGIEGVEVSVDGGASWSEAEITASAGPRSWFAWSFAWDATAGTHDLQSRATDERGLRQPKHARWNQKGYLMNAIQTVRVTVTE